MAIIKFREMLIKITCSPTDSLRAYILNTDKVAFTTATSMNQSLEQLVDVYSPAPGEFILSISNAIADWLVQGFGIDAEVVELDRVNTEPSVIY